MQGNCLKQAYWLLLQDLQDMMNPWLSPGSPWPSWMPLFYLDSLDLSETIGSAF